MNLLESAYFALRGVLANKMRSALTMIGIIIGVAAVIILIAVGSGTTSALLASFSGLGADLLTITPSQAGTGGRGGTGAADSSGDTDEGTQIRAAELTEDDAAALQDRELAPDIVSVAPTIAPLGVNATFRGARHEVASFTGSTPAYLVNNNDTVQSGVPFTDADVVARRKVALVGVTVARELAGGDGSAVLGEFVQFNGALFRVIGILTEEGNAGPGPPGGNDGADDRVIAPLTATQDALTGVTGELSSIQVRAGSSEAVAAAAAQVRTILNPRRGVTAADEDYEISSASAVLETVETTLTLLTLLLGAVAGISLVVGGIGVMNIMLVTVTERTREIGIRKAIGAQRSDIIAQFLLEAVILSVTGGTIGVVIGVLVGQLNVAGVQLSVEAYSIYLAFGFSVAVGLFFGIYPANKAASLRPIEALRYE